MTKPEYIAKFKEKIESYRGAINGEYTIDNNFRYDNRQNCKISISACLQVIDIRNEAVSWLNALKIGDIITINSYGSKENVTILKINYKKKIFGRDVSDKKIIASIMVQTPYSTQKIDPENILYKNIQLYDIIDAYKHAKPNGYMFINEYDVKHINQLAS